MGDTGLVELPLTGGPSILFSLEAYNPSWDRGQAMHDMVDLAELEALEKGEPPEIGKLSILL